MVFAISLGYIILFISTDPARLLVVEQVYNCPGYFNLCFLLALHTFLYIYFAPK